MFEWVDDAVSAVGGWFGGEEEKKKQQAQAPSSAPAPPSSASGSSGQAKGGGYAEQAEAQSPNNQPSYDQQKEVESAKADAGATGLASWWESLWGGGQDKSGGDKSGGEKKPKEKSIDEQRKEQDALYKKEHKDKGIKSNVAALARYMAKVNAWTTKYSSMSSPSKQNMPPKPKPFLLPYPEYEQDTPGLWDQCWGPQPIYRAKVLDNYYL